MGGYISLPSYTSPPSSQSDDVYLPPPINPPNDECHAFLKPDQFFKFNVDKLLKGFCTKKFDVIQKGIVLDLITTYEELSMKAHFTPTDSVRTVLLTLTYLDFEIVTTTNIVIYMFAIADAIRIGHSSYIREYDRGKIGIVIETMLKKFENALKPVADEQIKNMIIDKLRNSFRKMWGEHGHNVDGPEFNYKTYLSIITRNNP